MNNKDIEMLISVRTQIIDVYNQLDAKNEPHGVIKQSKVAYELESMIKKIDSILKDKVKFA